MSSSIDRGISIYQEQGVTALFRKALNKLRSDTYFRSVSIRGKYSLTLDGLTVEFSAPTPTVVKRTRSRFKSEQRELKDLLNELRKDDVFFDIGANTGLYSFFAAKKCTDGEVIAFEPYPPNYDLLVQDVARNKFQNIKVIDVALSDSVGSIEFRQPDNDDIGFGSSGIEADKSKATIKVPTTTGDRLIADGDVPAPNVVKIDVEGAESLVIEGLKTALAAPQCRIVYCEVHLPGEYERPSIEDFGSSQEKLQTTLEEMGYAIQRMPSGVDSELFLKATK